MPCHFEVIICLFMVITYSFLLFFKYECKGEFRCEKLPENTELHIEISDVFYQKVSARYCKSSSDDIRDCGMDESHSCYSCELGILSQRNYYF